MIYNFTNIHNALVLEKFSIVRIFSNYFQPVWRLSLYIDVNIVYYFLFYISNILSFVMHCMYTYLFNWFGCHNQTKNYSKLLLKSFTYLLLSVCLFFLVFWNLNRQQLLLVIVMYRRLSIICITLLSFLFLCFTNYDCELR